MAGDALGRRTEPAGRLWGPLGDARRSFDELAGSGSRRLTAGAEAMGAARTFLGADRDRRYFVAAQNNAEMRDQGAVLSYVVVTFSKGRLPIERRGSIADLPLTGPTATPGVAGGSPGDGAPGCRRSRRVR